MKTLLDYPILLLQFHPELNGDVKPAQCRSGSQKKLWWVCKVNPDHIWEASMNQRAGSGRGCPFCAGKRVDQSNSLQSLHPEIARMWHPLKNGQLTPADVTAGSKKRVWWKCNKGDDHEWITDIGSKLRSGCPFCSGKRVSKTNCLNALGPLLAAEWHPTKNGSLTPDDVTSKSAKKVWWQCKRHQSHEWQAQVGNRLHHSQGCPYCANKRVCSTNNLKACYPEIAKQWHPAKNGDLTPLEIVPGSNKRIWWQCDVAEDHTWIATPHSRTGGQTRGCPFCGPSPRRASSTNNLAINYPEIAKQWHPTKNGDLTPDGVLTNTTKVFWWLCENGHHFQSNCNQRVTARVTCPYCSGYRIGQGNSLADKFPDVAAEWDYKKNGIVTPDQIAPKSDGKHWFKCKLGHSYRTNVKFRTSKGSGCPKCTNQSSQQELRVYCELKWLFEDAISRHRWDKVEFDIFVPSLKLAVEYDGAYWHKDSEKKDRGKNEFCTQNGINLFRLREEPLQQLTRNDVCVLGRNISKIELNKLVTIATSTLPKNQVPEERVQQYLRSKSFMNEALYAEYKTFLPLPHPNESLASTHPELSKFWDYDKNYPLTPEHFTSGSNRKVYWTCRKKHSFKQAVIVKRDAKGCPVCHKSSGTRASKTPTVRDKRQMKLF